MSRLCALPLAAYLEGRRGPSSGFAWCGFVLPDVLGSQLSDTLLSGLCNSNLNMEQTVFRIT